MTTVVTLDHDDSLPRGQIAPAGDGEASNLAIISDIEAQVKNLAEQVSCTFLALASNRGVASPIALDNWFASGAVVVASLAAHLVIENSRQ
jgi:hypothetical protein